MILDSFNQYHKRLYRGGWLGVVGSHRSGGLKTHEEVRLPNWAPSCAPNITKVAKSMDKSFDDLQPSTCLPRAAKAILRSSKHWCTSDTFQKTATVKVDLVLGQWWFVSLLIKPSIGSEKMCCAYICGEFHKTSHGYTHYIHIVWYCIVQYIFTK